MASNIPFTCTSVISQSKSQQIEGMDANELPVANHRRLSYVSFSYSEEVVVRASITAGYAILDDEVYVN